MNPPLVDLAGKDTEIPFETLLDLRNKYGSETINGYLASDACNPAYIQACRGHMDLK